MLPVHPTSFPFFYDHRALSLCLLCEVSQNCMSMCRSAMCVPSVALGTASWKARDPPGFTRRNTEPGDARAQVARAWSLRTTWKRNSHSSLLPTCLEKERNPIVLRHCDFGFLFSISAVTNTCKEEEISVNSQCHMDQET